MLLILKYECADKCTDEHDFPIKVYDRLCWTMLWPQNF